MFVLDTEEDPNPSASDLGESDEKRYEGAMLEIMGVDGIEDPVEAEYGVEEHGCIVPVWIFVASNVTEETL